MTRTGTLGLSLLLACTASGVAFAQAVHLEQSAVVGEGKTIYISRLPVVGPGGTFTYWNGTINLAISAAGVPSSAASTPFTKSPKLVTSHFEAGQYYVKVGNCATQTATVTSGVGAGGSTVWTLRLNAPAICDGAYPNQATWQTGAPAPDVEARLIAAKVVKNPDFSYGLVNVGDGCGSNFCRANGLLAAEQISDEIELISYTNYYGDNALQQGSVQFVLCTDATCSTAPK